MRNDTIEPRREILSEASAWLVEFRADDPDQGQRDRFNAWLRASPQHIQAYFEVAAAWAELPDKDPEGRINIQQMIRVARGSDIANVVELNTSFKAAGARPGFSSPLKLGAIAASFLALLVATATYFYAQRGIYETQTGEQRSFALADGSSVELNTQSRIRVGYTDRQRHVDLLEGQALFHVAKSKARPFIVSVGDTQVRAVGTQFDIYRKRGGTIVTVLEGRVAVTATSSDSRADEMTVSSPKKTKEEPSRSAHPSTVAAEILLAAGEQLAVKENAVKKLGNPDIEAATAWTQKRLVFEDTPLVEVAEEFNRYNMRPIVIVDPQLLNIGVSGLYSSTDATALVAFLDAQPGILVTETDSRIIITRK